MILRHATQANIRLNLRIIQATRRCLGGDLERSLIFAAISAANVGQIEDDARLSRLYAHRPIPDDLRRPIRIQRISESLELPRETTRVKVRQLLEHGLLTETREGLVMCESALQAPAFRAMFAAYMASLAEAVESLAEIGACGLRPGDRLATPPFPAMWSAVRLVTQHALRGVVVLRAHAPTLNLFQAFLLLAMAHQAAPGQAEPTLASSPSPQARSAGTARRAISASALAIFTGYPRETVRRNLKVMCRGGWLIQGPGGFALAPPGAEADRDVTRRNSADLERLIRRLRNVDALVGPAPGA